MLRKKDEVLCNVKHLRNSYREIHSLPDLTSKKLAPNYYKCKKKFHYTKIKLDSLTNFSIARK